jgi:hypothetical protein
VFAFAKFRLDNQKLDEEDFLDLFDYPFLWSPGLKSGLEDYRTYEERLAQASTMGGWLYALRQSPENRNRSFVGVGRHESCDVIFTAETVSSRHAYFLRTGERWIVADAGSTNGTRLNGEDLEPHQRVPVKSRDHLQFGPELACYLLEPEDLFALLQRVTPPQASAE